MDKLYQPILVTSPEPNHAPQDVLTLTQFLDLLKEEEDYYPGEQHNTVLMITRLRKIFYDQWGWNTQLVRARAHIETRYQVTVVDDPADVNVPIKHAKPIPRYKDNEYQPRHRVITYRADDRVYGSSRVGKVPDIYKNDHQEVVLPDGFYCDVAHILAGLDAANFPQVVSPLPSFLSFLNGLVPHVDANIDVATWLGDIGSSSGDFLFKYLKNDSKPIGSHAEQQSIDLETPGSDMLGNIDTYVIARHYAISSANGQRVTEILKDYYMSDQKGSTFRQNRFSIYCQAVGLKGWDGDKFANEAQWLAYYYKQLRNDVCFQVFSLTVENLKSILLMIRIFFNGFPEVLKLDLLLRIYLNALKGLIKQESHPRLA
ncbi:hypothetical protein [Salmonirosea aquatica]|uniref:Uncharacterized protein n=1 Tax=Salmonirosea aquatica TaxID=2654236 RepID=A0A7C9BBS2_9BACT|nr:hypothetical protein [Cytophagaceae bacterium SJW1-29]